MEFEERESIRGGMYHPAEPAESAREARSRSMTREAQRKMGEMADRGREAVTTMRQRMAAMGEGMRVEPWMGWALGLFAVGVTVVAALIFLSPYNWKNRMQWQFGKPKRGWWPF